jgi:hypothetical protein
MVEVALPFQWPRGTTCDTKVAGKYLHALNSKLLESFILCSQISYMKDVPPDSS